MLLEDGVNRRPFCLRQAETKLPKIKKVKSCVGFPKRQICARASRKRSKFLISKTFLKNWVNWTNDFRSHAECYDKKKKLTKDEEITKSSTESSNEQLDSTYLEAIHIPVLGLASSVERHSPLVYLTIPRWLHVFCNLKRGCERPCLFRRYASMVLVALTGFSVKPGQGLAVQRERRCTCSFRSRRPIERNGHE